MKEELLRFDNVSYSVKEKEIISGINWTINKGEQWVLIGPNGAGKSTLLKLIYGFIWPNRSGNVYRRGEKLINLSELRKSIGLVTNDLLRSIPMNESVFETVISGKYAMLGFWSYSGFKLNDDVQRASEIMKKLHILKFCERYTQTLSHGELQKVLLARALMSEPYLILLDEPLDGLDPGAQENFLDTLNEYIAENEGPSFIYVTHHIHEIMSNFKKMLMIKSGKIFYQGDVREGMSSGQVSELYDYPFKIDHVQERYRLIRK